MKIEHLLFLLRFPLVNVQVSNYNAVVHLLRPSEIEKDCRVNPQSAERRARALLKVDNLIIG